MKIRHKWESESEGRIRTLRSSLVVNTESMIPVLGGIRDQDDRVHEKYHEASMIRFLYGHIEREVNNLKTMAGKVDVQTLYDKMREIATMCRNPTWLE